MAAIDAGVDSGEYACRVGGAASSRAETTLYVDVVRQFPFVFKFSQKLLLRFMIH